MLRGKRFGINEQYPGEIEQRRRMLYPHIRHARRNGRRANLVKDKLYVENEEIGVNANGDVVDRQGRTIPPPPRQPTHSARAAGVTENTRF